MKGIQKRTLIQKKNRGLLRLMQYVNEKASLKIPHTYICISRGFNMAKVSMEIMLSRFLSFYESQLLTA